MKLGKKNRCLSFLGQVGLFSDVMEKTERKSRSHAPGEGEKRDTGNEVGPCPLRTNGLDSVSGTGDNMDEIGKQELC